jgi:hypothetical protein
MAVSTSHFCAWWERREDPEVKTVARRQNHSAARLRRRIGCCRARLWRRQAGSAQAAPFVTSSFWPYPRRKVGLGLVRGGLLLALLLHLGQALLPRLLQLQPAEACGGARDEREERETKNRGEEKEAAEKISRQPPTAMWRRNVAHSALFMALTLTGGECS